VPVGDKEKRGRSAQKQVGLHEKSTSRSFDFLFGTRRLACANTRLEICPLPVGVVACIRIATASFCCLHSFFCFEPFVKLSCYFLNLVSHIPLSHHPRLFLIIQTPIPTADTQSPELSCLVAMAPKRANPGRSPYYL
jgi:hypothetical protein